jgi:hypothetical protein
MELALVTTFMTTPVLHFAYLRRAHLQEVEQAVAAGQFA